jgi:hypothetical protein
MQNQLSLRTTDTHGFCVTESKFDSFIDSLAAFEFAKNDYSVGKIELHDESNPEAGAIKTHTTLWCQFS